MSGSGKSSLVFDTIAAEAQRQLNETFTAFVQGFLPHYGQPDVDRIEHLNAPIIIDQKRVGGGSRSTAGTYTDIAALLRLLFSRVGQPYAGPAYAFSFNTPQGMCPECEGIGKTVQLDLEKFLDRSKSLNEGAILHPEFKVGKWMWKMYAASRASSTTTSRSRTTRRGAARPAVRRGPARSRSADRWDVNSKYEGLVERFTRMYIKKDAAAHVRAQPGVFEQFTTSQTLPGVSRREAQPGGPECRIDGQNIAELSDLEATELIAFLEGFTDPVAVKLAARPHRTLAAPRGHWAGLPEPQPGDLHPVRRRVAAGEDDPAPRATA